MVRKVGNISDTIISGTRSTDMESIVRTEVQRVLAPPQASIDELKPLVLSLAELLQSTSSNWMRTFITVVLIFLHP